MDQTPLPPADALDPVTLARIQAIRQALGSNQPYQFQPMPPPPGSHPAQGFLDQLAMGLAQRPVEYQPLPQGNAAGPNFVGGLLSGAANAFAARRATPIAQYQNYQSEERQRRIDENKQAVEATLKSRGGVDEAIAKEAAQAAFATPKAGAALPDPGYLVTATDSRRFPSLIVGSRIPSTVAEGYGLIMKPKEQGPSVPDDQIANGTIDFGFTDAGGSPRRVRFVDGTSYKTADERASARSYGVRNKTKVIEDPKTVGVLTEIGSTLQGLQDMRDQVHNKLAALWADPKRGANAVQARIESDPELASYKTYFPTQIAALKDLIVGATGGNVRITNAEINRWLGAAPDITDPTGTFDAKYASIVRQLTAKLSLYGVVSAPEKPPAYATPK